MFHWTNEEDQGDRGQLGSSLGGVHLDPCAGAQVQHVGEGQIGTRGVDSALVSNPQCAQAVVGGVEHEVCSNDTFSSIPRAFIVFYPTIYNFY